MSSAGCQMYGVSIEEAIATLKKTLDQMIDEGEL
jgi:c-di-AMP phosphodiesterase-like protein